MSDGVGKHSVEEIEIQEKECADNNERWERSRKEYESEEKKFLQRMKELEKEVQSLHEQRLKLSRKVDQDLLNRYTLASFDPVAI